MAQKAAPFIPRAKLSDASGVSDVGKRKERMKTREKMMRKYSFINPNPS